MKYKAAFFAILLTLAAGRPAAAELLITVDTWTQQMTVTVDGMARYEWPVSTGGDGYATPAGSFRPFRLEAEHYSKEWDDAPMPHSIFFTEAGHAIHGTLHVKSLGAPVSHGCVRLAPKNAARLFALVKAHGFADSRVEVIGGELGPEWGEGWASDRHEGEYYEPVDAGNGRALDFERIDRWFELLGSRRR